MSIYLQLFLASFFWGTNIIVMKLLLQDIPFLFLACLRVFFSLFFLGIYMKWKGISFHYDFKKKALIIGVLSIYLNFFFTFLGINQVKGVDNALVNALAPILTFGLSILLLKRKGSKKEYIAMGLSLVAFLLSIQFQIFSIQIGFWYLFLGMLLYMLGNILIQKWQMRNSISLSFYELLYGFMLLLIHCLWINQFDIQSLQHISLWYWILFLVISGIGFAFIQVTYMKSIRCIGALKTSFFLSLNPIFTYIESLLFLNEKFNWIHFFAFVLVAISILLIKKQPAISNNSDCSK